MLAVLFPGQGSQTPDDPQVVACHAADLLARACEALGCDPFEHAGESTAFAQVALHLASAAHWRRIRDGVAVPGAFAGHSLGEIGALAAAGAITDEDALALVVARGAAMAKAQAGTMLAVRADAGELGPVAALHGWVVANDNAPGQVVLSGPTDVADALQGELREHGWRSMRLPVTGAFHSPLMEPAAEEFAAVLEEVVFNEPMVPVWCCATAAPFVDPARQLAEAITAPVRWRGLLHGMHDAGVRRFLETGPGVVLDGLVRRTLPEAERLAIPVAA